jgi:serine/threonine protein kinase
VFDIKYNFSGRPLPLLMGDARPHAGPPSDMWSLGVMLFGLLFGFLPFGDIINEKRHSSCRAQPQRCLMVSQSSSSWTPNVYVDYTAVEQCSCLVPFAKRVFHGSYGFPVDTLTWNSPQVCDLIGRLLVCLFIWLFVLILDIRRSKNILLERFNLQNNN